MTKDKVQVAKFAVSLSHRQCRHFGVEWEACVDLAAELGIRMIRLPVYWSELQTTIATKPQLRILKKQLTYLQQHGFKICLQVGVKALWWPEYYFPKGTNFQQFLASEVEQRNYFNYLAQVIQLANNYPAVMLIQVENEPFNPSGPKRYVLPVEFMKRELEVVKKLTNKPLLSSTWLPGLHTGRIYKLLRLKDLEYYGLHFYYDYEVPGLNWTAYLSYWLLKLQLGLNFRQRRKQFIISELQAMPWRSEVIRKQQIELAWYRSWLRRLVKLPVAGFWLWGLEFWQLRRERYQDESWVELINSLTRSSST